MVLSITPLLIASLAAHATFANPIPPPDCSLDNNSPSCTASDHHGAIGIPLPPRAASPCALNSPGCGPIVVSQRAVAPTPTSISPTLIPVTAAATCIPYTETVPIYDGCSSSSSSSSSSPSDDPDDECISIICFDVPQTCGCPGAPPPIGTALGNRDISSPTATATLSDSAPAATCTPYPGPLPIFELCSRSGTGAQRAKCIADKCAEFTNTCGCPGSSPESPAPVVL